MTHEARLGGVLLFSGYYLGPTILRPHSINEGMPIFISHGEKDCDITLEQANNSYEELDQSNREFIF